jgi:hypothetical protein
MSGMDRPRLYPRNGLDANAERRVHRATWSEGKRTGRQSHKRGRPFDLRIGLEARLLMPGVPRSGAERLRHN